MNTDDAAAMLALHRPGREADGAVKKAIRLAEKDPALSAQLAGQLEFDGQLVGVINSIQPPDNLVQKLRAACNRPDAVKPKLRTHAFNPAILTAILGVLLIVGFVAWTVMERMEKFPGREAAERMLSATSKMTGVELDPVTTTAGTMGDWFYMRGFEGYAVPKELSALPAVGSRVFRIEGHPIAQIAVDRHESLVYVFRASDFGVEIGADEPWRLIEYEGWVGALRRHEDVCSMVAFRGDKSEMRGFLAKLKGS
ncbi:MAG: hypothetical protein WCF18_18895 [Chthoniobacteraceae bacterium]